MSSSPIIRMGSEDGEASDSGNDALIVPATVREEPEDRRKDKDKKKKHHKHKHDKERKETDGDEEERLRRRLIEKKEKGETKREDSGDDESELFTIQPGADQKRREREKEKMKDRIHDREDRDRERDRRDVKSFHDHREDRRRELERREWKDDRRRDNRPPSHPSHASQRGHTRGVGDRERSHRRSRSRSAERRRREEKKGRDRSKDAKRERKESDRKKEDKEKEKEKSKVAAETEKVDVKEEDKEEEKMEEDEKREEEEKETKSEVVSREGTVTPVPVADKKTKKFAWESSPESNEMADTPEQSDVEFDSGGPMSEGSEVEPEEEEDVIDLSAVPFEELTEEQKLQLSPDSRNAKEKEWQKRLVSQLPVYYPGVSGCRNIAEYECMNRIEEGTFGVVYRGKNRRTDEVVALKRLKMDREKDGFPITSLREVNMLLKAAGHENIVNVLEIVVGSSTDKTFLVMEFVEHDMKSLMDTMSRSNKSFKMGEVKTLMMQLLRGMDHLHNLWILHRDLKSSNLLLNHRAVLKIADFGLAREYGEPLKSYTPIVVTLWYRSPELLLGIEKYSTEVDMWSVGCLMAEFLTLKPLFNGRSEIEQVKKIFMELGTPSEKVWKGYDSLRGLKEFTPPQYPYNQLRKRFPAKMLSENGFRLLNELLRYDPVERITASDALLSEWFKEDPEPIAREMFPTFPAKSEPGKKPPPAPQKNIEKPQVSEEHSQLLRVHNIDLNQAAQAAKGFTLKF